MGSPSGNISPNHQVAYREQLAATNPHRSPLLILYLHAPTPDVTVERIQRRGRAWEIRDYDAEYCREMHEAHLEAFKELALPYVQVDWSADHPGGAISTKACLAVLETALGQ